MGSYLARRALLLAPALLALSFLTFATLRLIPGDPAEVMFGEHAAQVQVAGYRASHGLDQALPVQYLRYLEGLAHGDWGRSLLTGRPVRAEIAERLPATIELSVAAMLVACLIGFPAGLAAAYRRGLLSCVAGEICGLAGVALPLFWLGLLASSLFGYRLGWLPPSGRLDSAVDLPHFTRFYIVDSLLAGSPAALRDCLRHLALPALTLCLVPLASITRMTRACTQEAMGQDYVRTARGKGLPEPLILARHALRGMAAPMLTMVGLQLASLFSGAILIETVFSWPGMGQYVAERVLSRDYPAVQGVVLVSAVLFVLVNVGADVASALIDPRVRHD